MSHHYKLFWMIDLKDTSNLIFYYYCIVCIEY